MSLMNINEEKKIIFESLTKTQTDFIFKYDQKMSDLNIENNSNIRNIIILEAAFLSALLIFLQDIFKLDSFNLSLFLEISLISFLISILSYSFLLKEIATTGMMGSDVSIFILNQRFEIAKIFLKEVNSEKDLESAKRKIDQVMCLNMDDKALDYILSKYYIKFLPKKYRLFLHKFASWKNWYQFFAHVGNYLFVLGLISGVFLVVSFIMLQVVYAPL